jgi:small subunit ribosomal protein S3
MGQKVNAHVLRLGQNGLTWDSRWFNERQYKEVVFEDFKLRTSLMNKLFHAGIAKVEIERSINTVKIIVHVSKPGVVIGRGGSGIEELKKYINAFFMTKGGKKMLPRIEIKVEPVKEPNLDATLVAKNIAEMLIRRLPYKRVLAQTSERVMGAGASGVRVVLSGRIGGSEIGRREKIQTGTVPLSTIRERINYASFPALTKKGYIGVKVWINVPSGGAK